MIFEDGDLDGDKALTLAEWEKLFQHRDPCPISVVRQPCLGHLKLE